MINNISSKSKNNLVLDFTYTEKQEYLLKSPPPHHLFLLLLKPFLSPPRLSSLLYSSSQMHKMEEQYHNTTAGFLPTSQSLFLRPENFQNTAWVV